MKKKSTYYLPLNFTASKEGYDTQSFILTNYDYHNLYENKPLRFDLPPLFADAKCYIDASPSGAELFLNGTSLGELPRMVPLKLMRQSGSHAWMATSIFEVRKEDYQTVTWNILPDEVKPNETAHRSFAMHQLRKEVSCTINSVPSGATVMSGTQMLGVTPCKVHMTFARERHDTHWNEVPLTFEMENYFSQNAFVTEANTADGQHAVSLELRKIAKNITLDCNIPNAEIWIDGRKTDLVTPHEYSVTLERDTPDGVWPRIEFAVGLPRYQHKQGQDKDSKDVTSENIADINVLNFTLEKKLWQETRLIIYSGRRFREEHVRAYLWDIEKEPQVKSVTKVTNYTPYAMIVSRLAVYNDKDNEANIIYSLPDSDTSERRALNLWSKKVRGVAIIRLTQGDFIDSCPTLPREDGRYVLFSSNRLGHDYVWRFNITGRGGFTKITGSNALDSWPTAISQDKICYTSRLVGSLSQQIWSCNFDGTLPTQLREGEEPDISPDGKKIAYIALDSMTGRKKLWVMDIDGGNPTQITTNSNSNEQSPSWHPDGKRIIYASNQGITDGKANYDIWMINLDGVAQTQLTVNGSDDRFPVVDKEGKFVYFYSNRGIIKSGCSEIWRLELN